MCMYVLVFISICTRSHWTLSNSNSRVPPAASPQLFDRAPCAFIDGALWKMIVGESKAYVAVECRRGPARGVTISLPLDFVLFIHHKAP